MKKLKKSLALVLSTMLCIGAVGCSAPKEGEKSESKESKSTAWNIIKDKGELVVGMCPEYPPFSTRNEAGDVEGFDADFAKALGEELGVKVTIKDTPWEGLVAGLQKGDHDVVISAMSPQEATSASQNVNMSNPYYELSDIIIVQKDNKDIKSKEDLKGKTVGLQATSSCEVAIEELNKTTKLKDIRKYNRTQEAVLDLQNGRIDAVAAGIAFAASQIKDNDALKIINDPIQKCDLVVVMNKGEDELTSKINDAISAIKENGKYDELVKKWLDIK